MGRVQHTCGSPLHFLHAACLMGEHFGTPRTVPRCTGTGRKMVLNTLWSFATELWEKCHLEWIFPSIAGWFSIAMLVIARGYEYKKKNIWLQKVTCLSLIFCMKQSYRVSLMRIPDVLMAKKHGPWHHYDHQEIAQNSWENPSFWLEIELSVGKISKFGWQNPSYDS